MATSPKRGCQVPRWYRRCRSAVGASAVRVSTAGAEAPSVRLRGPSVRRSVRAEAQMGYPGAACVVGPSGPKAFWIPALPKRGRADTVCRWSVRPEGLLDPCFAEARQGRHCPVHRSGLSARGRRGGSGMRRWLPADAVPLRALRRSAQPSVSLREPKPVAGRGRASRAPCGKPRGGGEGAFLVLERARATAPVWGKLESQTLKGCGYVKEHSED